MPRGSVKPPSFSFAVARDAPHAVALLEEAMRGGRVLAGGQSLIPLLRFRMVEPSLLVDIGRIDGFRDIAVEDGALRLGACVTHAAIERWAADNDADILSDAAALVGHVGIRTFGTIGGSLAHADPAAEWAGVVLALGGECDVLGPSGLRTVSADDLFAGPFRTSLAPAEIITSIRMPLPAPDSGAAFEEVAPRRGDPAVAGAGVVLRASSNNTVADVRVGLIGLAPTPIRAHAVEDALRGTELTDRALSQAAELVNEDISPPGDVHASDAYRRRVAPGVTARALMVARDRSRQESR